MVKVSNCLKGKKSYIAFPIHDSIVIDFSTEDGALLKDIIDIFATTDLGKFMVNVSAGTNFGQLKKVGV